MTVHRSLEEGTEKVALSNLLIGKAYSKQLNGKKHLFFHKFLLPESSSLSIIMIIFMYHIFCILEDG